MLGFRYDGGRDAYVLRLVGGRFGPVLRTDAEAHDSAAKAMDWPDALQREEERQVRARRRSGRFSRDQPRPTADPRHRSLRD
jgi:hypothetical protein